MFSRFLQKPCHCSKELGGRFVDPLLPAGSSPLRPSTPAQPRATGRSSVARLFFLQFSFVFPASCTSSPAGEATPAGCSNAATMTATCVARSVASLGEATGIPCAQGRTAPCFAGLLRGRSDPATLLARFMHVERQATPQRTPCSDVQISRGAQTLPRSLFSHNQHS